MIVGWFRLGFCLGQIEAPRWLRLDGFGGWGLNRWLWVASGGSFQWWVFLVGLNRWLGISFNGCGLLLVGVLVMGNFVWVESVVGHKFRWLWVVVSRYFDGKYFWLG